MTITIRAITTTKITIRRKTSLISNPKVTQTQITMKIKTMGGTNSRSKLKVMIMGTDSLDRLHLTFKPLRTTLEVDKTIIMKVMPNRNLSQLLLKKRSSVWKLLCVEEQSQKLRFNNQNLKITQVEATTNLIWMEGLHLNNQIIITLRVATKVLNRLTHMHSRQTTTILLIQHQLRTTITVPSLHKTSHKNSMMHRVTCKPKWLVNMQEKQLQMLALRKT